MPPNMTTTVISSKKYFPKNTAKSPDFNLANYSNLEESARIQRNWPEFRRITQRNRLEFREIGPRSILSRRCIQNKQNPHFCQRNIIKKIPSKKSCPKMFVQKISCQSDNFLMVDQILICNLLKKQETQFISRQPPFTVNN